MGKRKKSARSTMKTPSRKGAPLATTFSCLFCNHENCVTVKLDKKLGFGNLSCKVCGQRFQTGINYLSAAVDVYADWVDACDAVAKDEKKDVGEYAPPRQLAEGSPPGAVEPRNEIDIGDDDIDVGY